MVCWHRRYSLGDHHDFCDPQAFAAAVRERDAIILPLYLFDHSGLSISTASSAFRACDPAGWDWGQVGYIYVEKARVRWAFGAKHLTSRVRARVEDQLRGEVATYDQYLRGQVYGFNLSDRQTGEVIDSCWGFYGDDPCVNGMADHFPSEYRDDILSHLRRRAA
jgi:hypothetical protein